MNKHRLAVFASGGGSNAEQIFSYFKDHPQIEVALVLCNKEGAGVIDKAQRAGIEFLMIEKERFFRGDAFLPELYKREIYFLALAGFLWKVPQALIDAYRGRILNIHPALLPKFGGKGMYGLHVHKAVIEAGEPESGITIHLVDEHYDKGDIVFRASCPVLPGDEPTTLAERVLKLEHESYPRIIEEQILKGT